MDEITSQVSTVNPKSSDPDKKGNRSRENRWHNKATSQHEWRKHIIQDYVQRTQVHQEAIGAGSRNGSEV